MAQVHIQKVPAVELAKVASTDTGPTSGGLPLTAKSDSLLARVLDKAAVGHYEQAIQVSKKSGATDLDVQNARGVCLMRTGKYDDAVQVFRNLVMQAGCTWMRVERPVHYKVNFATALLLSGRASGCLEMLEDLNGETTPMVERLRTAIGRWEKTLPWMSWLNWKVCRIASPQRRVALDFEPGEFRFALPQARTKA